MLLGLVRAGTYNFVVPIPNRTGITVTGTASNGRLGGGNSLIFQVDVTACSIYATDSVASATIVAYSDSNIDTATRYARVGFHHVIVPAGGCATVSKTVRVHHASEAAVDNTAYLVATAVVKRDGVALTASDSAWVDVASIIPVVLA